MTKVLLVILDGWGHSDFEGEPSAANAIEQASVPRFRALFEAGPRTRLACSGGDVGLPDGQMGNSEVGHLNLGAGRVVFQDIARIDRAIADGSFGEHLGLDGIVAHLEESGGRLHVLGLVSDGGVHSHLRHFAALFAALPEDLPVRVHCMTDGRDTSPFGGVEYLARIQELCDRSPKWMIATVSGRYYAMDRDNRWERTERAYRCIVEGKSTRWEDSPDFLSESYRAGVTDEFVAPTGIVGVGEDGMGERDVLLLMNFRADRMRQLSRALVASDFREFQREGPRPARVVTMTRYEEAFDTEVAFGPVEMSNCLAAVLAANGVRQLRVAETEKYAHVTYFFNGGEERPFEGEERALVPSPRVATYDLQPEMSAAGVTKAVVEGVRAGSYDFILVNFANPDMVGHTGSIPAAIHAVEFVDGCLAKILETLEDVGGWVALVTADHGNAEKMLNEHGAVHTAHTTEPVDLMIVGKDGVFELRAPQPAEVPRLADVAPTVLDLMGLPRPREMTGRSLISARGRSR